MPYLPFTFDKGQKNGDNKNTKYLLGKLDVSKDGHEHSILF